MSADRTKVTYVCVDCDKPASEAEFRHGKCKCGGVIVSDESGYAQEFKIRRNQRKAGKRSELG